MTDKEFEKLENQYIKEKARRDNLERLKQAIKKVKEDGLFTIHVMTVNLDIKLNEKEKDQILEAIIEILETERRSYETSV